MIGVLAPPTLIRLGLIKAFLSVFLPFTVVLGVVAGMHYYTQFTTERSTLESRERLNVELAGRTLANDISNIVSDLLFLAEDIENQGLLVLNFLGQRLIDNFIRAAANIADHIHLLNGLGYWLRSPDQSHEWDFMYGANATFPQRFPRAWQALNSVESSQIETEHGLFSFSALNPLAIALGSVESQPTLAASLPLAPASDVKRWIVVAHVVAGALASTPFQFLRHHVFLYLTMLLLIAIGSWLLARSQLRRHQVEAQNEYEQLFRRSLESADLVAISLEPMAPRGTCATVVMPTVLPYNADNEHKSLSETRAVP